MDTKIRQTLTKPKINDPKVLEQADVAYCWPTLGKNIKEADAHASIIWQMIPEEIKEKWKTI